MMMMIDWLIDDLKNIDIINSDFFNTLGRLKV